MHLTVKCLFILTVALLPFPAWAQAVPPLMNYQGRLTEETGAPLTNGTYRLAFRLYTNAVPVPNEPLIWGQEYDVTLLNGSFNVILGANGGTAIGGAAVNSLAFAFGETSRYLELRIIRDAANATLNQPILPRQQLISTPYAIQAQYAQVAATLVTNVMDNLVPAGTIVAYGGESTPPGWLVCNGQTYRTNEYPKLWAAIGRAWGRVEDPSTFRVPQLEGVFLRGWNRGAPYDPEATERITLGYPGNHGPAGPAGLTDYKVGDRVGSFQADTVQTHQHNLTWGWAHVSAAATSIRVPYLNAGFDHTFPTGSPIGAETRTGAETRPKNVYVNYIIRY